MKKNCEWCGIEFEIAKNRTATGRSIQRFHAKACAHAWRHANEGKGLPQSQCQVCGRWFKPKRKERTWLCPDCHAAGHRGWRKAKKIQLGRLCGTLQRIRVCPVCGKKSFRRRCSKECQRQLRTSKYNLRQYKPIKTITKSCIDCGGGITISYVYGHDTRIRCRKCQRKRDRASHPSIHVRRAKRAGVAYQYIRKVDVFERDGWRCHLCKRQTPKRLMGSYDLRAPELDHIKTFNDKGPHVYTNVKCICRQCNIDKGGKSKGQPLLFGMIPTTSVVRQ